MAASSEQAPREGPSSDGSSFGTIYTLSDRRIPHDFRYVGQTIRELRWRVYGHRRDALTPRTPKEHWIRSVLDAGADIVILPLQEQVFLADLDYAECRWIIALREVGYDLLNVTRGGLNRSLPRGYYSHSEEVRAHLREVYRPKTAEQLKPLIAAGRRARKVGVPGPANSQAKLSAEEVRAIRSSPLRGHALAEQYGVTRRVIWLVQTRRSYQSVV